MRISGVIEGFYGPPWSHAQRLAWIDRLAAMGMGHYVWAAKAEPRHRSAWSEPFTDEELTGFSELAGRSDRVEVGVALTPGPGADADAIIDKLAPAVRAGASFTVLSCDDMPSLDDGDHHRRLAHAMLDRLGVAVWVVPTHYCGTSPSPYLAALTDGLSPSVELMWTGAHVVNDEITTADATRWADICGRPPVLWDNTPVSDGPMSSSLHLGPLSGREAGLRDELAGVVWNPMEHSLASTATLASAAGWLSGDDPVGAWRRWVDERGWAALAAATAWPGDHHWPGDRLEEVDWQRLLEGLPDDAHSVGLDPSVQPWIDAAREGASVALEAVTLGHRAAGTTTSIRSLHLATRWRTWTRCPVDTFGSGVRIRPMLTQDGRGQFVMRRGALGRATSPVDRAVSAGLGLEGVSD